MVCAASNSGPLVCTRHVFGAGTIGKIFISDAHKERGGSAVFSFVVHRTIAAGGRSKLVDPRSCAGGYQATGSMRWDRDVDLRGFYRAPRPCV